MKYEEKEIADGIKEAESLLCRGYINKAELLTLISIAKILMNMMVLPEKAKDLDFWENIKDKY